MATRREFLTNLSGAGTVGLIAACGPAASGYQAQCASAEQAGQKLTAGRHRVHSLVRTAEAMRATTWRRRRFRSIELA